MVAAQKENASIIQYELEIEIQATRQRVWKAIIEETNGWWLPDFHMVGADSIVSFDPAPGGKGLVEELDGGASLQWYAVQLNQPQKFTVYLVGHVAPDWGGPSTSHLKLGLKETETGCKLQVMDAQVGRVSEQSIESLSDGWGQLFGQGLKPFVEHGTRQDL